MTMGSVEYLAGTAAKGRKLFQSLIELPKRTKDICQIIDEAGTFLTGIGEFEDSRELYREALKKFPRNALPFHGLGYCAGKAGLHEKAVSAHQRAVKLEPDNQAMVNDLGWTLAEAGRLSEAIELLERAVSMSPRDKLARENLRLCREQIEGTKIGKVRNEKAARRGPRAVR